MTVKFKKGSEVFDSGVCMRNLNFLAHSQVIELFIGSQCGGHGKCAGDKIIFKEADRKRVNPPTELERRHFTQAQLDQGIRLACQCFPNHDDEEFEVEFL